MQIQKTIKKYKQYNKIQQIQNTKIQQHYKIPDTVMQEKTKEQRIHSYTKKPKQPQTNKKIECRKQPQRIQEMQSQ